MFVRKTHSISKKLTRMNMLVSGAALLLACCAFVAFDLVTFRQNMVRNLSIQAQIIGANSVSALLFDDPQSAADTLSGLKASPNIKSAGIYTARGKSFAEYRRDEPDATNPPDLPSAGATESYRFTATDLGLTRTITFDGNPTAIVYIRSDLREMSHRMQLHAAIVAGVLLASFVAAFLVSSLSERTISGPIMKLVDVARVVSRDKSYSMRAAQPADGSEIGILVTAFNQMLDQIQARGTELQNAHDEMELRVRERTAQLAATNAELEAFCYSVSHDLRAPLRAIDGFSKAVMEDYCNQMDDAGRESLERIRAAAQRMASLIDDLLSLSRITRAEMRLEPIDLSEVSTKVIAELRSSEPTRQVEFVIEPKLRAEGDPQLIRTVLENLIGNAWKFTSKRPRSRIEVGAIPNTGETTFFVRDNGAGFDQAYAKRLFAAFQRLHRASEFPGTGVGLASVQRVVNRHGGRIWAEGALDQGATFYFTLPRAPDSGEEEVHAERYHLVGGR
jgi:signal transduction histidine kinase